MANENNFLTNLNLGNNITVDIGTQGVVATGSNGLILKEVTVIAEALKSRQREDGTIEKSKFSMPYRYFVQTNGQVLNSYKGESNFLVTEQKKLKNAGFIDLDTVKVVKNFDGASVAHTQKKVGVFKTVNSFTQKTDIMYFITNTDDVFAEEALKITEEHGGFENEVREYMMGEIPTNLSIVFLENDSDREVALVTVDELIAGSSVPKKYRVNRLAGSFSHVPYTG